VECRAGGNQRHSPSREERGRVFGKVECGTFCFDDVSFCQIFIFLYFFFTICRNIPGSEKLARLYSCRRSKWLYPFEPAVDINSAGQYGDIINLHLNRR
jgi:hypothetical protein